MNMDGHVWSAVYDNLKAKDYEVTVVQLPMTSIEDDIAATRRAIGAQHQPVVLVGHSYGGMVISQAGTDPKVKALVYIAAFQPDIGQSLADLNSAVPAELPQDAASMFDDGYVVVRPEAWIEYVANGLPDADARHTAIFQTPVNSSIFGYKAKAAAWKNVPSWSAIAKQDRTVAPTLQREMSQRAGATVVEIDGGHLLPMSHPAEVAGLIETAAAAIE
jgi:pimeloyl-ACP methyl ester carboxylesterase